MKKRKIIFVFFLLLSFCLHGQEIINTFNNWQFRQTGDTTWYHSTIPGTVHTDLYANKLIPDPFYGLNEYKLQWIEKKDWEYKCKFDLPKEVFNKNRISLVFEGLDTYAKIYLNDSLILRTDNMFRKWETDCKKFLKEKNNELRIIFESSVNNGIKDSLRSKYILPGGIRVYTRKAQYQYGWDWSPRYVTCGIWKPAFLRAWDEVKLEDVQYFQDTITKEKALLHAVVNTVSENKQDCKIVIKDITSNKLFARSAFTLTKGINSSVIYFQIDTPRLWWTNGLGEPYQYKFELAIYKGDSKICADTTNIGIRTIELIQQPDSAGKTFYFKLNGIPVFMKGANFIPADNFLPRVSKEKYENLVNDAMSCNMNILRIWGGGVYEDDYFYKLCDEKGILVWQDFMFACGMYPGDTTFLENVNKEAIYQIKRLRNHPCIALWCGNNEISEGWYNWGWQKQYGYSQDDSIRIWKDYKNLFENILSRDVNYYDYGRPYWPSSPMFGWGRKESLLEGDSHYWGVWWGMEPFSMYEKKVGRFMSEFGFQSYPADKTMQTYLDFSVKDTTSNPNPFWHNKHSKGFQTIDKYLLSEYYNIDKTRKAIKNYTYLSQLLQAYGVRNAIEAHRRAMPYCMGTLYWQFDDCWPGVSWSGIDYFGRWKALQYFVKKAYSENLVSVTNENNLLKVYVVSDCQDPQQTILKMRLIDFYGKEIWEKDSSIKIASNSSICCFRIPIKNIIADTSSFNKILFVADLFGSDSLISRALYYFKTPKDLVLPKVKVKKEISIENNTMIIKLKSNILAKNVFLSSEKEEMFFSDNYFDLLPGESRTINAVPFNIGNKVSKQKIKIVTMKN